jgi:superfamily II DNA/RNA helicase
LIDGIDAMNFQEMTPVQEKAMPVVMEGKDLIACAQTGTGKTAAYLLPLINQLLRKPSKDKVRAIIMAPTRELAQQIDQQLEGISYFVPISSVAVYGGNDASAYETQKQAMKNGTDIIIATPGRLISHIKMENADFSGVEHFILDEADRMLDMGFYDDIISIVKTLPVKRQTVMFSATMPAKIKKLAETILHEPEFVNVAISKPAEGITQQAYICYETQKRMLVQKLLANNSVDKTIIFSSSKQNVKDVYNALLRMKIKVGAMHSDLDQAFRDEVMLDYKSGKINVIVATDILSRGIDIEGIDMVINYDVPHDAEDYIHRIGRTARANRQGVGITFVSEKDQDRFGMIEQFLEKEIEKMPLPEELGEGPAYEPRLKGKGGRRRQNNNRSQTAKGKQPNANSHKPKADGNESQEPKANRQHFKPNANGNDESQRPRRYNNHHRRFNNRNRGNNNSQQGDLAKDDSVG